MSVLYRDSVVAEGYARHRGDPDEGFIDVLGELLRPARTVLDVGAGVGGPAAALYRRGFSVLAVEPSMQMMKVGRSRYPGVSFVQAFGEALPIPGEAVDGVTLLYVLHHVEDPVEVLDECRRVLRSQGRVVVASGCADSARQRFFEEYFPTLAPDLPDAGEICEWGERASLDVCGVRTAVHWVYQSRTIDEQYLRMVENEMFAALRELNPTEFDRGLRRLRADAGKPVPPPEVAITVLERR